MPSRTFRAAVIGRTGRGNYGHGLDTVWKRFANVTLIAVADDHPQGLAAAGERLGVRALYGDYRRMLAAERPDIVAVAPRWVDCHHDMVIAAAEAGASVYLEKPMARTPAEADRMIDACDRAHVKLAVAHQMRISPAIEQAKRLLGEGALGRLQELRGRGKEDRRAGGEDLMVLGAHVMDLMRQFAGDPLWAFGRVTTAGRGLTRAGIREGPEGLGLIAGDAIAGLFGFRDGLTGYFASKQCGQSDGGRFGVDLYGSEGILSIRAATEPQIHLCSSSRWTNAPWRPVASPAPAIRSSPEPAPPAAAPGGASPPAHLAGPPPRDANVPLVADLLEAIEQDRPPRASGVEARWTIEMAMALYESERTGARVRLPLADRGHPLEKLG